MKNSKIIVVNILVSLSLLIGLVSCGNEHDFAPFDAAVAADRAQIKFIHTAVGPLGTNFGVNLFINNVKVSAVGVSTGLPIGTGYSGIFPQASNYAAIPSGAQTLNLVIPARAAIPATNTLPAVPAFPDTTIATSPLVTEVGKNYSRFLVGVSPNYSIFNVTDDLSVTNINEPRAFIRFFNFITNTPPGGYDLVFIRTRPATSTTPAVTTTIRTFSNVGYLGGSPVFEALIPIPILETIPDVVQLRLAGTSTIVATLAVNFVARPSRAYTFIARGLVGGLSNGLPSATFNIPTVAFHINR